MSADPMMAASEPLTRAAERVGSVSVKASTERVVYVEVAQRIRDEAVAAERAGHAKLTEAVDQAAASLAAMAVDLLATDEKRAGQLLDIATALRQATDDDPVSVDPHEVYIRATLAGVEATLRGTDPDSDTPAKFEVTVRRIG